MSENATATANPATDKATEPKPLTAEEKAKLFEALPSEFKDAINDTNTEIEKHNRKVDSVKASESRDPKLIKAEIYEQNTGNNKKLARIREQELKLQEQIEKLRTEAYKIIDEDGLMPKELSESEVEKLKSELTESTKDLRSKVDALRKFEEMLPMLKGKITIHIEEIKTRRGMAKASGSTTSGGGEGTKRPRFKKIEINGITEDDKGNTVYGMKDGEPKYTFTFASQYLRKHHKGINWGSSDLQDAYFKGLDENNLPEVHEFVMPYTYKDAGTGNEHTVNYTIKAYR